MSADTGRDHSGVHCCECLSQQDDGNPKVRRAAEKLELRKVKHMTNAALTGDYFAHYATFTERHFAYCASGPKGGTVTDVKEGHSSRKQVPTDVTLVH